MSIEKGTKKSLISKFAINKKDTGSAEIQIAILSERIKNLTEHLQYLKKINNDFPGDGIKKVNRIRLKAENFYDYYIPGT